MAAIHQAYKRHVTRHQNLFEIICVSLQFECLGRRCMNARRDAVLFSIGFGRFLGFELYLYLGLGIPAARPTHERIGAARFGLFEFEHPFIYPGFAGRHCGFRALIDTCGHGGALTRACACEKACDGKGFQ